MDAVDGTMVMPATVVPPGAVAVPPSSTGRRYDWRLLVGIAVVLLVIGVALASRGGSATRPVPDVTNATVANATTYLEGAGLHVEVANVSSSAPAGTVVRTDPPAGSPVAKNGTVRLDVSSGPPVTTAPPTTAVQVQLGHHKPGKHGKGD